ncbi:MAG: hypothetical protein V4754_11110 [Pseudomonadota bacterium]
MPTPTLGLNPAIASSSRLQQADQADSAPAGVASKPNPKKRGPETQLADQNQAKRARGNFDYTQERLRKTSPEGTGAKQANTAFPHFEAESLGAHGALTTVPGVSPSAPSEAHAAARRNSVQTMASMPDNVFDRLGEPIPQQTLERLAKVVEQRVTFKKGQGPVASLAKKLGLTNSLAMPTHLAMVLHLAFTDPEMLKIAKMGIRVALSNPETGGVPPEGFKPLYDLLKKWGYSRQGQLRDPEKFNARLDYMEQRRGKMDELKQFSAEIETRLPEKPAEMVAARQKEEEQRDKPILSLLAEYFMPPTKPKDGGQESAA